MMFEESERREEGLRGREKKEKKKEIDSSPCVESSEGEERFEQLSNTVGERSKTDQEALRGLGDDTDSCVSPWAVRASYAGRQVGGYSVRGAPGKAVDL